MKKSLLFRLLNVDLVISGTALSVLIIYTFLGVIMRYFVKKPVIWGEEFQLFCIVIIVFFGAGAGFRAGSHVAIDIIVDRFPRPVRRAFGIFIYLATMGIFIYFGLQSAALVRQMLVTGRTTDILDIPFFVTYSAFPIGCVLMMLNYTITVFSKVFGGEGS